MEILKRVTLVAAWRDNCTSQQWHTTWKHGRSPTRQRTSL